MMRSLFAGVSGLRNHQVRMDVIGNNIANVNTVAFKSSRVTFEEAFAQMVQGASRPAGDSSTVSGGTNPIQVGLGMNISSIDLLFTQGNLENTGVTTDLAIQGDSFFVMSDGQNTYYTRSGNFQLDANGRLVSATNGHVVQGKLAVNGEITDTIGDLVLPFGQKSAARATTRLSIGGNLDAEAAVGATRQTTIVVYDAMGRQSELTVAFKLTDEATTPEGGQAWSFTVSTDGQEIDPEADPHGYVVFDGAGRLHHSTLGATLGAIPVDGRTGTQDVEVDGATFTISFGRVDDVAGLSQFAGASTAVARDQDGYTMGQLERIGIDQTGTIVGAFTNGVNLTLGQLVLADFNNPTGLIRTGDNAYATSANSGAAVLGFAGEGSQSVVMSGALEMSNVDLAQEFTAMITAQRGFQSNARVITASDEMLQELVSLKR
jgi:flagellar hook protein FlgE